jgi:hypothetical protein
VAELIVNPTDALNDEQLARVQVIYERAFSRELRVPFGELARSGLADLAFVAMEGTAPVGFAALRLLSSVEW